MNATLGAASHGRRWGIAVGAVAVLIAVGVVTRATWRPHVLRWLSAESPNAPAPHDDHDHAADHGPADSLEISDSARANIGLKLARLTLGPYERVITVPGIIAERPGRSTIQVVAPLTGVVTRIEPVLGQAVSAGERLFEIRLTHEELVKAQGDFLRTAEELDVVAREITRLEKVSTDGAVAGKALLDRKYEQQKELATQRAQHQALLLHGLTEEQIQQILKTRTLLQGLAVAAPAADDSAAQSTAMYQVQELKVDRGQHVEAGAALAVLADHGELQIEGSAFEKDIPLLRRAWEEGWKVSAVLTAEGSRPRVVADLALLHLAGKVDPATRSLPFVVRLPNVARRRIANGEQPRFIDWEFRPGQRVQLRIPVERWTERIVLPAAAVVEDGPEAYAFIANGKKLERRAVHVEHRDPLSVVVAHDGAIFPGEEVVVAGAEQLMLALKNKAGGAIDPHAGHNH